MATYFAPFKRAKSSLILGSGISAGAPFLVPPVDVTAGNKEFTFLQSMYKWNCWGEPSGVCFLTTTMGLAHGDVLFCIIPTSSKSLISHFKKSQCLRGRDGPQLVQHLAL